MTSCFVFSFGDPYYTINMGIFHRIDRIGSLGWQIFFLKNSNNAMPGTQLLYDGIWLNYYPIIFSNIIFHLKQGQWSPLGCVSFGTHWNSSIDFVSLSCVSRFSMQINVHFHLNFATVQRCFARPTKVEISVTEFSFGVLGGGFWSLQSKPDRGFVQSLQELASAHGEESVIMVSHRAWMDLAEHRTTYSNFFSSLQNFHFRTHTKKRI